MSSLVATAGVVTSRQLPTTAAALIAATAIRVLPGWFSRFSKSGRQGSKERGDHAASRVESYSGTVQVVCAAVWPAISDGRSTRVSGATGSTGAALAEPDGAGSGVAAGAIGWTASPVTSTP